MAKADPRETTGRPGPVRTSSGTRVVAVRLTPLEPSVASRRGANDLAEMPTRELDLEQLREMALRCASDVGHGEPAQDPAPEPAVEPQSRPRLELVLGEDEMPRRPVPASRPDENAAVRSRRSGGLALVVLLVALAVAAMGAFKVYGILP